MHCLYYQAHVNTKMAWFVSGFFRSEEHFAFIRALNGSNKIFEFFVPPLYREDFLKRMSFLIDHGYIISYQEQENRLVNE